MVAAKLLCAFVVESFFAPSQPDLTLPGKADILATQTGEDFMWQPHWMMLPYILAAVLCYGLSIRTWNMRPARGAAMWSGVMFSCGTWALASAFETIAADLSLKLIVIRFSYFGITGVVFFWTLFVLNYCHYDKWITRRSVTILAIAPVTMCALVLTLDFHSLIYKNVWLDRYLDLRMFAKIYGPAFWVWAVYGYLSILTGSILIIQAVLRFPNLYQRQALLLIVGTLIPTFSNVLYITKNNPIAPFDPSSIAFTFTGVLVTIGISRYHLLDLVPVAYDLVFRNVGSGVVILDTKGRIVQMNPAAERILNRRQDDLVGKPVRETLPEHKENIERFRDVLQTNTEISLNGRIYELQIMPLAGHSGNVAGRIVLMYDITESRQAAEDRERLILELDAYARTVAHDLKTPLSVLIGYIGLMERSRDQFPENLARRLPLMSENARKMVSIIDSLLLLANVRSSREVRIQPLNMNHIVRDSLSRLTPAIEDSRAHVQKPDTWPEVWGYAPWVEAVWVNYISNAIKYGGSPPIIHLGADPGNGVVRFWVRDNGEGLNAEQQSALFQEFSRIKADRKIEGHGLGLSIVSRIVERLGGQAGVESEPGRGSLFYFTLSSKQTSDN